MSGCCTLGCPHEAIDVLAGEPLCEGCWPTCAHCERDGAEVYEAIGDEAERYLCGPCARQLRDEAHERDGGCSCPGDDQRCLSCGGGRWGAPGRARQAAREWARENAGEW